MARIITKGQIGAQDLQLGTSTFTRATSTGGTLVMNQVNLSSLGQFNPVTYANLPASPVEGMVAAVTDAATNSWGSTVSVGGGFFNVLVFYDGSGWKVFAN